MILTLTPNPSVDRTIEFATEQELVRGEVLRATTSRIDPGGKGINVSRALAKQGLETIALFPSGGTDGDLLQAQLAQRGITAEPTSIADSIRSNVTLAEASGVTTKINLPGPKLSADDGERLLARLTRAIAEHTPSWVVASGSLPQGLDTAIYANGFYSAVADICHAHGTRLAIDSSGRALAEVAHNPDVALLKPNVEELAELCGVALDAFATAGDVASAARSLLTPHSNRAVLVSLGARGALLVTASRTWLATPSAVTAKSTVAAGDSTLAGYVAAFDADPAADPADALAQGVRWGTAAVTLPGTEVPGRNDLNRIDVSVVADPPSHTAVKE